MNIKNTYQNFINKLQSIQSEGEANAIARIVFEDAFKLFDKEDQDLLLDINFSKIKSKLKKVFINFVSDEIEFQQ